VPFLSSTILGRCVVAGINMAHTKLYGKDLKAYQDVDLDALLAKLTDAELEELHTELIDPDVCGNFMTSF